MSNLKIDIIDSLVKGTQLFKASIAKLAKYVLPWLAAATVTAYISENADNIVLRSALKITSALLNTIVNVYSVNIFLGGIRNQDQGFRTMSGKAFFFFFIANEYIWLAAAFGTLLLFFPALLIYASACFTPIFILDKQCGPFESLDKSIGATRGNVWRMSGLLMIIFLASAAVNAIADIIPAENQQLIDVVNISTNLMSLCLGLISTAVITILYEKLGEHTVQNESREV